MKIDVFNRPLQKVAVFVKKNVSNDRKSNTVSFLVVRKKERKIRRVPLPSHLILPSQFTLHTIVSWPFVKSSSVLVPIFV